MPFEHYIRKDGRNLRLGYTTGSCAVLAAKAATRMLLAGRLEHAASIVTPKGLTVDVELVDAKLTEHAASCAVKKFAGDDPDVTDGVLVYAEATRSPAGVAIDGGVGVGRVTRPGLDQPVGQAAINRVPRLLIDREVRAVCDEMDYDGGVSVVISVPDGERLAARTFNPNLGITGGLSIIGTSGIVMPMSNQAIIDTVGVEMRMHRASGARDVVIVPGNYGEDFARTLPALAGLPVVKCSNFIGEALDMAAEWGFARILLVGHLGKLVKLAGGIMDTHSRVADCRLELLALHAALAGIASDGMQRILDAVAVDEGVAILDESGLREKVIASLLERIDHHLRLRLRDGARAGAILFTNGAGLLGVSKGAADILSHMERK